MLVKMAASSSKAVPKVPEIERWNQEARFSKNPYFFRDYFLRFWQNNRIVKLSLLPKLAFSRTGLGSFYFFFLFGEFDFVRLANPTELNP